ncbi:HalOD1 output domain-containing protein [Natronoarchaeum rubrum]|uniref:HalOD1 output domain-containing protein n=1 Tax=Natronoarchaeum rubrum TaxID=755311 RepID=UPI00211316C7|nr:HalOD1 output domain-containing protein [Natronoarchaeum rubrum]
MTGTTHNGRDAQRTIEREWDDAMPPSTALVRAVADARGVEATELPPLYDVVDADALDSLVREQEVTMTIEYQGFLATIRGDGRLELVDQEDES